VYKICFTIAPKWYTLKGVREWIRLFVSWLREVVTPKIKAFVGDRSSSVKDNAWRLCPGCEKTVPTEELAENMMVCGYCSHHFLLPIKSRLGAIFDGGLYDDVGTARVVDDPLKFRDNRKYVDRLKDARQKTGQRDAAMIATGNIHTRRAVVFAVNFAFMGGSMGLSFGKTFIKAVETATNNNIPLIGITASGGARMQEGIFSLMQMPATVAALIKLKTHRLPYINVFTNPTTGGVLASFSMLGDIHIAEPGALIGFAGPKVIEKTLKHRLPDGFQRSEFLREHGMIDIIVHRHKMAEKIGIILDYLG
jgi:acetyl-CoA carboxylase carboxyl transferase subunit beta